MYKFPEFGRNIIPIIIICLLGTMRRQPAAASAIVSPAMAGHRWMLDAVYADVLDSSYELVVHVRVRRSSWP
jgi:hypothetical protein